MVIRSKYMRLKENRFLLVLMIVVCGFNHGTFKPVNSSNVQFYITNAGVTVDGYFDELVEAAIDFDPSKLSISRIHARIQVSSLKTGIGARDRHLMEEPYFHQAKYPFIEMVSTKLSKRSEGKYIGHFNLTIKGKTERVKVPFTYIKTDNKVKFEGIFTINRLHFEVGEAGFILGSNVKVKLTVSDRL